MQVSSVRSRDKNGKPIFFLLQHSGIAMTRVYLSIVRQHKDFVGYGLDYPPEIIRGACLARSPRKNSVSRYQVTTNPEA